MATRRASALNKSGAIVSLLMDDPSAAALPQTRIIDWSVEQWTDNKTLPSIDLSNYWLVFAASDNATLNEAIARECEIANVFCHIEKNAKTSSFLLPAIVDRSPLLIAISSGGAAPTLARTLKTRLESLIPSAYAGLAQLVASNHLRVKESIPGASERAAFWHRLLSSPLGELSFSLNEKSLQRSLDEELAQHQQPKAENTVTGTVSLIGAGPGAPDLLTFKALRLIQSADVIVHDRLVSPAILDLRRDDAELIYAGKAMANHAMPQHSINQLLVDLAKKGQHVVRLKGGDPFIFGRGGEEIETLADQSVPFQVVPGITAASGCAAFSGIPLTHRDHAQSCVFVTGHLKNDTINLDWENLRDPNQTIVVYMGLTGLARICEKLIENGRDENTPAALVERGTTPDHKVHSATLSTLPSLIEKSDVIAPTLLIIGGVVSLREKLDWFEPLNAENSTETG